MAAVEACAAEAGKPSEEGGHSGEGHCRLESTSSPGAIAELVQGEGEPEIPEDQGPFDDMGFPVVPPSLEAEGFEPGEREAIVIAWRQSLGSTSNISPGLSRSPSVADYWGSPSSSRSPCRHDIPSQDQGKPSSSPEDEAGPLSPSQRILKHRARMSHLSPNSLGCGGGQGGGGGGRGPSQNRPSESRGVGTGRRAALWLQEVSRLLSASPSSPAGSPTGATASAELLEAGKQILSRGELESGQRASLWVALCELESPEKLDKPVLYQSTAEESWYKQPLLLGGSREGVDHAVRKDLHRTFPGNEVFSAPFTMRFTRFPCGENSRDYFNAISTPFQRSCGGRAGSRGSSRAGGSGSQYSLLIAGVYVGSSGANQACFDGVCGSESHVHI